MSKRVADNYLIKGDHGMGDDGQFDTPQRASNATIAGRKIAKVGSSRRNRVAGAPSPKPTSISSFGASQQPLPSGNTFSFGSPASNSFPPTNGTPSISESGMNKSFGGFGSSFGGFATTNTNTTTGTGITSSVTPSFSFDNTSSSSSSSSGNPFQFGAPPVSSSNSTGNFWTSSTPKNSVAPSFQFGQPSQSIEPPKPSNPFQNPFSSFPTTGVTTATSTTTAATTAPIGDTFRSASPVFNFGATASTTSTAPSVQNTSISTPPIQTAKSSSPPVFIQQTEVPDATKVSDPKTPKTALTEAEPNKAAPNPFSSISMPKPAITQEKENTPFNLFAKNSGTFASTAPMSTPKFNFGASSSSSSSSTVPPSSAPSKFSIGNAAGNKETSSTTSSIAPTNPFTASTSFSFGSQSNSTPPPNPFASNPVATTSKPTPTPTLDADKIAPVSTQFSNSVSNSTAAAAAAAASFAIQDSSSTSSMTVPLTNLISPWMKPELLNEFCGPDALSSYKLTLPEDAAERIRAIRDLTILKLNRAFRYSVKKWEENISDPSKDGPFEIADFRSTCANYIQMFENIEKQSIEALKGFPDLSSHPIHTTMSSGSTKRKADDSEDVGPAKSRARKDEDESSRSATSKKLANFLTAPDTADDQPPATPPQNKTSAGSTPFKPRGNDDSDKTPIAPPKFLFGSTTPKSAPSAPNPGFTLFGAINPSTSTATNSSTPSFGATSNSSTTGTKSSFGQTSASEIGSKPTSTSTSTPASGGFTFSSTNNSTPAPGGFTFSSTNSSASSGGGFLAQFSKSAAETEAANKQKAKDEDYDSEEETEEEWSKRYDEQQAKRKADAEAAKAKHSAPSFTPMVSSNNSAAKSPFSFNTTSSSASSAPVSNSANTTKESSTTAAPKPLFIFNNNGNSSGELSRSVSPVGSNSVLFGPKPTGPNIFSNLPPQNEGEEEEDDPTTPKAKKTTTSLFPSATAPKPTVNGNGNGNGSLGKSLFDRVSPRGSDSEEAEPNDLTYKKGTPIKFTDGNTNGTPKASLGTNITNSAPPKFSFPPSTTTSSFGSSVGKSAFGTITGTTKSPFAAALAASSPAPDSGEESTDNDTADEAQKESQTNLVDWDNSIAPFNVLWQSPRAKAMKHKPGRPGAKSDWEVQGVGPIAVLKDPKDGVVSIFMKQDPSGKVMINTRLSAQTDYTNIGRRMRFLIPLAKGGFDSYLIQVSTEAEAIEWVKVCNENKSVKA